jgi:catechol 2,3-dioxygenase-like lactoylglutathione lyase family enzyme
MPDIQGLHHFSLSVRDIEQSAAWYERVVGLTRAFAHADAAQGWAKLQLVHQPSGMRLSFTEHRENSGEAFTELRTGLDHFAFRVEDQAALEEWEAHLTRLGVAHSPIKRSVTGFVLTFRDPDNIQLEVFAPRAAASSDPTHHS